ncbi:hypothetical protein RHU54_003698 [Salmonella enterica]|nr:hypothetical protein [Salmonella enterica]
MSTPPIYHYLKNERLTGCFRFRSARFTGRPIMQVQIASSRIKNERGREENDGRVTFWRDATLVEALTIQLRANNNGER